MAVAAAVLVGSVVPVPTAVHAGEPAGVVGLTTLGHVLGYGVLALLGVNYSRGIGWPKWIARSRSEDETETDTATATTAETTTATATATETTTATATATETTTATAPTTETTTAKSTTTGDTVATRTAGTAALLGVTTVVLAVTAYGAVIEAIQAPLPWRTASMTDLVINAVSAACGALIAGAMRFYAPAE